jgi:hypothetical protein
MSAGPSPTKPPFKGHTGHIDFARADDEFCRFFRCKPNTDSVRQLDRLSLLACDRQGVTVAELLPSQLVARSQAGTPTRDAATPSVDAIVVAAAAKRRTAKFAIVEQERKQLHQLILASVKVPHLSHDQRRLLADLRNQEMDVGADKAHRGRAEDTAPLMCQDVEEDDDVNALLDRHDDLHDARSRLQQSIDATRRKGEEEVRKLRERHLRFVAHDIALEAQRRQMIDHIEERDRAVQHMRAVQQETLAERAKREAKEQRRKLKALRIRNDALDRHRADELEDRSRKQDELWGDLVAKRERELEARRAASAQRNDIAKQRADRVRNFIEKKCETLEHEVHEKLALHAERKTVVMTRLEISREARRVQALRKFYAARQYVENKDDGTAATRHEIETKEEEAERRKQLQDRDVKQHFTELTQQQQDAMKKAEERRAAADLERAKASILIFKQEIAKDADVAAAKASKAQRIDQLRGLSALKREHHADNLARLERQREHAQRQKDALLKEQQERDRAQHHLRVEMAKKMQAARQRLAEDRERVQQQVSLLRNSRDLMEHTPESILEASLRRERPASTQRPHRYSPVKPSARPDTAPVRHTPEPRPGCAETSPSAAVEAAATR